MNYRDYVDGISFRLQDPERPPWAFCYPRWNPPLRVWGSLSVAALVRRLDLALEILNTRLPVGEEDMRARLRALCQIPRMSTFAMGAMINAGVAQMPAETCFVNVGVWNGFTLLSGMAGNPDQRCIGVDNFSEFGGPRDAFLDRFEACRSEQHSFHDMDYEVYFAKVHREPIGIYIYDGEHGYRNQLKGLQVAEPFFADGCYILVDDTNLPAPRQATVDFMKFSRNRYELVLDRRTASNLHPTLWNGVMILQKLGPRDAR